MDVVLEKFCQGCRNRHCGTVWYYRQSAEPLAKVWLCGIRYLLLEQEDWDLVCGELTPVSTNSN